MANIDVRVLPSQLAITHGLVWFNSVHIAFCFRLCYCTYNLISIFSYKNLLIMSESLGAIEVSRCYLITYSSVNEEKFPKRESFAEVVNESFSEGNLLH